MINCLLLFGPRIERFNSIGVIMDSLGFNSNYNDDSS